MIFKKFQNKDHKNLITFLQKYEPLCISLIQNLFQENSSLFLIKNEMSSEGNTDIVGIIFISKGGTVLHCLPDVSFSESIKNQIAFELYDTSIYCINGCQNGSDFLISLMEKYMGKKCKTKNTYQFMIKTMDDSQRHINNTSYSVRLCNKNDIKNLLPLELAYQEEEVLPPGEHALPRVYTYTLSKQMNSQFIFCATENNGTIIGKAATNAQSWNWAQIGGVYTIPDHRRTGIAFSLIENLTSFLLAQKKNCALFVNDKNLNAYQLYQKCGFKNHVPYCIAYYS